MRLHKYEYGMNVLTNKWNFRLRGSNGEIQFQSTQGYNSEADVKRGIRSARRNSIIAVVRKVVPWP